jgi:hypothetical protein
MEMKGSIARFHSRDLSAQRSRQLATWFHTCAGRGLQPNLRAQLPVDNNE